MSEENAINRIKTLREKLSLLNKQYFLFEDPSVEDSVYDSLKRELKELEDKYPDHLDGNSPTQKVGESPSEKFQKVPHITAKKSLEDIFSEQEIDEWFERISKLTDQKIDFLCELKNDGLNITIHYQNGSFQRAITRGDGKIGEDVTHTVSVIKNIPHTLNEKVNLEVSGEVFMSKNSFIDINQKQKEQNLNLFANPRNAASGSVRQLDREITKQRNLDMYFYSIGEKDGLNVSTQEQLLKKLKELGFHVCDHFQRCENIEEVKKFIKYWTIERENLPYEIDGIVVKVNSLSQQKLMGQTAKHPRFAVAYKFPAIQVATKIENIAIQVGRTGALTPVAEFKPVHLAGSIVRRATLHNADNIVEKDIKIGDTVVIQKAGDVIPEVVKVLKEFRTGDEKSFIFPNKCPQCGKTVIRQAGESAFRCENMECPAILRASLKHFVSRKAFNLDGLGKKIIDQLIANKLINKSTDIFNLKFEDLLSLPSFKDKKANNIINSIENAKNIELNKFLFSLGIRYLGEQGSYDFSKYLIKERFQDTNNLKEIKTHRLVQEICTMTLEEIVSIDGIGEKIGYSLFNWFKDDKNIAMLNDFDSSGIVLKVSHLMEDTGDGKLKGLSFVITGTLQNHSRDELTQIIKNNSGQVSANVSKNTNYLIVGEEAGSKLDKANKLKIPILTEQEFFSKFAL